MAAVCMARCPSAAVVRAVVREPDAEYGMTDLDFCGHHWKQHGPVLGQRSTFVVAVLLGRDGNPLIREGGAVDE